MVYTHTRSDRAGVRWEEEEKKRRGEKTICNISIVWEINLRPERRGGGSGCGGGGDGTHDLVMLFYIYYILLLFSIGWPHSRGTILDRFALSAGPIVSRPSDSPLATHTTTGYTYRFFFFFHTSWVRKNLCGFCAFALLSTYTLDIPSAKPKIILFFIFFLVREPNNIVVYTMTIRYVIFFFSVRYDILSISSHVLKIEGIKKQRRPHDVRKTRRRYVDDKP